MDSIGKPNPKRQNLTTAYTMAGRRPPIIRSTNEDVQQDVCALTKLLEAACLDATKDGEIYYEKTLECQTKGLDAYHQHHDQFEEALSQVFFKSFNEWVNVNKAKGQTKLEHFKADFDWPLIENEVRDCLGDDFSEIVKRYKTALVTSMVSDLANTCCKEGSSMAIFLSGKTTTLSNIQQAIL